MSEDTKVRFGNIKAWTQNAATACLDLIEANLSNLTSDLTIMDKWRAIVKSLEEKVVATLGAGAPQPSTAEGVKARALKLKDFEFHLAEASSYMETMADVTEGINQLYDAKDAATTALLLIHCSL